MITSKIKALMFSTHCELDNNSPCDSIHNSSSIVYPSIVVNKIHILLHNATSTQIKTCCIQQPYNQFINVLIFTNYCDFYLLFLL